MTSEWNGIAELMRLIERLRGENGCPWDKKQTPQTLAIYLIEEMYELVEAIQSNNPEDVCEEIGDVLFQILFIAILYQEHGNFTIQDVTQSNIQKMVRRHPHVFGNETAATSEDVRQQWHAIKMAEKKHDAESGVLNSIPSGLPALIRAYRVSERAARAGFDWNSLSGVMEKVEEEWAEFKSELDNIHSSDLPSDPVALKKLSLELGDILFTLVNVARFAKFHPETSLADSTHKFEKRFRHMEKSLYQNGDAFHSVSYARLNEMWEQAKQAVG